jgi:hypothetical protein
MKFNKWTLSLVGIGAVSLASAVRADEAVKLVPLNTLVPSTTISGYVDTAVQYNLGNYSLGANTPAGTYGTGIGGANAQKVDSFTLNDIDIALDKPEDATPWASGYHVDLNYGTDAVGVSINGTPANNAAGTANAAIRQGYVVLRTPAGNGIDWKFGVQDDIIGYEGNTDGGNPNYTRSVGYSVEPTTLLGLIGSYKISDAVTVQGGVADATSPSFVATSSDKTFAAAVAFTAPDSFGWAKGASLNLGALLNLDKNGQDNYYAGLTLPTPWTPLKLGAALDVVSVANQNTTAGPLQNNHNDSGWIAGIYGNIQATDKLSFNLRGEYFDLTTSTAGIGGVNGYPGTNGKGEEFTATLQYNLWANVTSRAEFRWDHADDGRYFGSGPGYAGTGDAFLLAANLIYTF